MVVIILTQQCKYTPLRLILVIILAVLVRFDMITTLFLVIITLLLGMKSDNYLFNLFLLEVVGLLSVVVLWATRVDKGDLNLIKIIQPYILGNVLSTVIGFITLLYLYKTTGNTNLSLINLFNNCTLTKTMVLVFVLFKIGYWPILPLKLKIYVNIPVNYLIGYITIYWLPVITFLFKLMGYLDFSIIIKMFIAVLAPLSILHIFFSQRITHLFEFILISSYITLSYFLFFIV